MPITIIVDKKRNYFISKYSGTITGHEILNTVSDFFHSGLWCSGLNELVELSEADLSGITADDLIQLSTYVERLQNRIFLNNNRIIL